MERMFFQSVVSLRCSSESLVECVLEQRQIQTSFPRERVRLSLFSPSSFSLFFPFFNNNRLIRIVEALVQLSQEFPSNVRKVSFQRGRSLDRWFEFSISFGRMKSILEQTARKCTFDPLTAVYKPRT